MFKYQDKVQWNEGNGKRCTCTGTIVCEEKNNDGSNPHGFWTILVDVEHYHRACHTASEMNSGWVSRATTLNNLQLLQAV